MKILNVLRTDDRFSHYYDFVYFLLLTGCRLEEAIGLRWENISEDCSRAWIGESIVRRVAKNSTKTNKARWIDLHPNLKERLLERRKNGSHGLVFTTKRGHAIGDTNFYWKIWKRVLEIAEVEYRKPYTCRATFISHWLEKGENPIVVAEYVGHSPEVLFKHYAGAIKKNAPKGFLD